MRRDVGCIPDGEVGPAAATWLEGTNGLLPWDVGSPSEVQIICGCLLQRGYLERMDWLMTNDPDPPTGGFGGGNTRVGVSQSGIRPFVRGELNALETDIEAALTGSFDQATEYHLQDAVVRIDDNSRRPRLKSRPLPPLGPKTWVRWWQGTMCWCSEPEVDTCQPHGGASGGPIIVMITSIKTPNQLASLMTGGTDFSLAVGPKFDISLAPKLTEPISRVIGEYVLKTEGAGERAEKSPSVGPEGV